MTKYAIVDTRENKIVDLKEYRPELHPSFKVYEVNDEVNVNYIFDPDTETFSPRSAPTVDHEFARRGSYPTIPEQLGMLYKDIESGLFGESAKSGQFYQVISNVKSALAKGRTNITIEEMEAVMLANGIINPNEETPS
jgi:hypothetical protein